ncbi:hypothetical protein [Leucobacter soli]|uniref:hypothetical protein n=1 Tax=Leucobacter soli TaxID=2812850 RepID=UPI00360BD3EB
MSPAVGAVRRRPSLRLVWMLPAGLSLLAGLDAALLLLGLPAPVTTRRLPETHGMLLVVGFVGTLIALERATALRRWYGYAAPGLLGLGGVLLVADPVPLIVAKWILAAGAAAFTALYIPLWRRRYDAQLLVQLLAAGFALAACVLWIGGVEFPASCPGSTRSSCSRSRRSGSSSPSRSDRAPAVGSWCTPGPWRARCSSASPTRVSGRSPSAPPCSP